MILYNAFHAIIVTAQSLCTCFYYIMIIRIFNATTYMHELFCDCECDN